MLESGPTRSQGSAMLAVCEFRIAIEEHCQRGYGQVCANAVAPEAHQNDRSYVCELSADLLSIHYTRI